MALYYLDWYAVKYFEGGHPSKSANKGPSSYLKDYIVNEQEVGVKGAYILYQTKSGKPEVWEDVPQYLKYYEFADELVTPILSINNSPRILCICQWPAYESITKILSMHNINSQYLVSVFHPQYIDDFSGKDLSQFDAVFLIDYKYKNRSSAFSKLSAYVENGGKVFIDTGTEVAESKSGNLPTFFPFRDSRRDGLGGEWNLESIDDPIFVCIDFEEFSPPLYNENDWKFSY